MNIQVPQIKSFVILFPVTLFFVWVTVAHAATLSVTPGTGVYTAGGTFTARVVVNTKSAPINASEGTLSFDTSTLSVVSVSKGSIFSLWTTDPTYSNSAGTITFGGGSPQGYTGSAGTVMSVTFRTKTAGTGKVSFLDGSILAADGKGTNVLTSMNSGAYTIVASEITPEPEVIEYVASPNTPSTPQITSSTHVDANAWYTEKKATMSWTVPSDVSVLRTLLDENSGSIPTKVYDTPIDSITIDDLDEGVQYFHLQFKNEEGWGRVAHYRLAVDTEKPSAFDISLEDDSDLSNPIQTVKLSVTDKTSGIAKFIIQIDGGEPYEYKDEIGSSTLTLAPLNPGHHSVIIEAYDHAENSLISTFSFSILAFDKPQFTEYPAQLNAGVIPVIKGVTRQNSEVTVFLKKIGSDADAQEYTVQSNENGEFIFIPESALLTGVYELTAYAVDQYGAKSEPSDTIRIAVQEAGYIQIGSFIVSVLSVIVPLTALVFLLVLSSLFFWRKIRTVGMYVVQETDDALLVLDREFNILKKVIATEGNKLIKSRKSKKLTKGEQRLSEVLTTSLKKAEKQIKKEISEVDDII